jgi:predicted DNA-binding ribbon-helix-helix protein
MTRAPERPVKHSLTLRGHRTSVSLEAEFWAAFRDIATARGLTLNALAIEVDEQRQTSIGLASAIRVFVLNHYRDPKPTTD